MRYLFAKKIKCTKCQGNFRGITERGKRKYYCSTYHNYRTCIRYKINEDDLIYFVCNHMEIQQLKNGYGLGGSRGRGRPKKNVEEKKVVNLKTIEEYVEKIEVDPENHRIELFYTDGSNTLLSPAHDSY